MEPKKYYNYLVYDDGRVYSNYCHRFLKGDITKFGYLQYTLVINNKSKRIRANRLVAFLFLEAPLNKEDVLVNHKDGNKLNNYYLNLEWSSYRKNSLLNLSLSRTDFYIKEFVKGNNNQYFQKYKIKIINTKK